LTGPQWATAPGELATSASPALAVTWPAGVTAAACLTFDMDAESESWALELEAMHRLGAAFVLCCHPFLSGRPARAEALERLIQRMKSLPGLWIATVGEVAEHTAALGLTPRTCPQPVLPSAAHWISPNGGTAASPAD